MKAGIIVALIISVGGIVVAQAPDLKQQWEAAEREWEAAQFKPAPQNTPVRGGTDGGVGATPEGGVAPDYTWPIGAGGAAAVTAAVALAIAWRRKTTINKDGSSTTEEEGTMAETITRVFPRGARPTPRHKLLAAIPHQLTGPTPPQVIVVPSFLEVWLNDTYGDCVTAEEAFAKAAYSVMNGLPETKITDATVMAFCNKYNVLNGADLTQVMDAMISDGFHQDAGYKNGPYTSVDYSNESVLQNAISLGPVKTGIDANALPGGAGNKNGWGASGGRPGQFSNEDHCVALCGYGPSAALFQALGAPVPSAFPASGYMLFTWATIGVVDHAWIMSTVGEAWLRNPTTAGVTPAPTPPPPPPGTFVPPFYTFEGQTIEHGPFADVPMADASAQLSANTDRVNVDVRDSKGNLVGTVQPGPAPGPGPLPPGPNSAITITVNSPLAAGSYEVFPVGTKEKFGELATLIAALGGGGRQTF
jgi:hypothetical protein